MKKTALRKKAKSETRKIQDKIWKILRERAINKYGSVCYTCGAKGLTGANRQLGHLYPKASLGAFLKYDERVLRIQCYRCNINLSGMGAVFYRKMLSEVGEEAMEKLEQDKKKIVKSSDFYKELLNKLENEE